MTDPSLVHVACSFCWESKCRHWTWVSTSKEEKKETGCCGCLTTAMTVICVEIVCNTCKTTPSSLPVKIGFMNEYTCSTCSVLEREAPRLFYSSTPITNKKLLQMNHGKYVRTKCPDCHGTNLVDKPNFGPCPGCKWTGGLACTRCAQTGTLWTTEFREGATHAIPQRCSCTKGFSVVCHQCQGQKAIVIGSTPCPCVSCV